MSDPSETEVKAIGTAIVDILYDALNHLDGTQISQIDTLQTALKGDVSAPGGSSFAQEFRRRGSSLVDGGMHRAGLGPVILQYGAVIASPGYPSNLVRAFRDLYLNYAANSKRVKSRNISFAAGSFDGGNSGNGSLDRLTVDENAFALEACNMELKTLKVVNDQNTGARKHAERGQIYGNKGPLDSLDWANRGSGLAAFLFSHHAGQGNGEGASLLRNGSFSTFDSGGDADTKFPGWVITNYANVSQSTNYFRGFPGSAENLTNSTLVDASILFSGNALLVQKPVDVGMPPFNPAVPYWFSVRVKRLASATGNVTIRLGASSATVALSSLTNGVWTILKIALGTGSWPANFTEQALTIEIEVDSLAVGTVEIDDAMLSPMDPFDGTWWFWHGGSTAWLLDDFWSGTDTAAATAKIQEALRRAGLGYLPSTTTASSITWAEP